MRLKSYFADTVESAMSLAAQELGDEAMLVYSRESGPETRNLGRYEVVFATEASPASAGVGTGSRDPMVPVASGTGLADPAGGDSRLWAELDRRLELLEKKLTRGPANPAGNEAGPTEAAGATGGDSGGHLASGPGDTLQSEPCDVTLEAAAGGSEARDSPDKHREGRGGRRERWSDSERQIGFDRSVWVPGRATILVGPAGAGKTTGAVKLAFWFAVRAGKVPRLVSLDTKKILGAEQLKRYAQLIGSEFAAPQSIREMQSLFEDGPMNQSGDQHTIVDMPGCGFRDGETIEQIREMTRHVPGGEVHLVLSAATRTADLFNAVERFASIGPARLIFTRLDETTAATDIWTVAAQTGIPISFLSDGTRIPDDFRAAGSDEFTDRLSESARLVSITEPLAAGV